jgi:hypothetical protein
MKLQTNTNTRKFIQSLPPSVFPFFRASVVNHLFHPRTTHFLASLTILLLFSSGCATRLAYRLPLNEKPAKYHITISIGEIKTPPGKNEVMAPPVTKSTYYITTRPFRKSGIKTSVEIKAEPEPEDKIIAGADLGKETIVIDPKGNISDRYGIRTPLEIEYLFPPLPEKKVKRGDTWKIKKTKNMAGVLRDTTWTYKYTGYGKGQKRHCQNISLDINHKETMSHQMPGGIVLNIQAKYLLKGDICFSNGRLKDGIYHEKFYIALTNPELSRFHMEKNSYTNYSIRYLQ